MKTQIDISKDYFSELSYEQFKEDLAIVVNGMDIFCEVRNNNFTNIVEYVKDYCSPKERYSEHTIIIAQGYSKSEWQEYTIFHNGENLSDLEVLLSKSFTHQHDYLVQKFDVTEIDGVIFKGEIYDYTSFCITDIEFPNKQDVINAYNEIYGKDYDIVNIKTS